MTCRSMRRASAYRRAAPVARPQTHAACPWCPPGIGNLTNRPSIDGYYVNCLECGATGPYAPSQIEAWVKWDNRQGEQG